MRKGDFNSRPYTRGDKWQGKSIALYRYFNSRPYTRGDAGLIASGKRNIHFNSRPYTRGDVTFTYMCKNDKFQLSPLHEGRRTLAYTADFKVGFQLSPLHEGRRFPLSSFLVKRNFNSRPYTRGDFGGVSQARQDAISTLAPTRGATQDAERPSGRNEISTLAPTRGATRGRSGVHVRYCISTLAPTRGATHRAGKVGGSGRG